MSDDNKTNAGVARSCKMAEWSSSFLGKNSIFVFWRTVFNKKIIMIASTNEKRSPEKSVSATPTLKLDDFDGSVVDATKIFPD